MSQLNVAETSLTAIRALMDVAGNNIANADTEGFHRKRAELSAVPGPRMGGKKIGQGVTMDGVSRSRNALTERLLLANVQLKEKFSQKVQSTTHLENIFNEPSDQGLDTRMGAFFKSVSALSANPDNIALRREVIRNASHVANLFNRLDEKLTGTLQHGQTGLEDWVQQLNSQADEVAALNRGIKNATASGSDITTLKDKRDQLITEMSKLTNLTTHKTDLGVTNVGIAGTLIVSETSSMDLEVVNTDEGFEVRREGTENHVLRVSDGKIGGMLEVANELIPRVRSDMDELANGLRRSVNLIHSTGLPLAGRFESLTGLNPFLNNTDEFHETGYGVTEGATETLVLNVEDLSTGEIEQTELTVDTTQGANNFVTALAGSVNGVSNLSGSVVDGKLRIDADSGYAFGFAPPYDPNPPHSAGPGTSTTEVQIHDAYTAEEDHDFDIEFQDTGTVGTDTVDINVSIDGGPASTYTIDEDYGGETLSIGHGLKLSLSTGDDATSGDTYSFTARGTMDSAGALDALGINTFFGGRGAGSLHVTDRIQDSSDRMSGALVPDSGDNHRFLEMAGIQNEKLLTGGSTLQEFYRGLVGDIGTESKANAIHEDNLQQVVSDLQDQRDGVSGVSVDEELMKMLNAQHIYQGLLRYVHAVDNTLKDVLRLI